MKFSLCSLFFVVSSTYAFSTRTVGGRGASALKASTVDTPPMARSQTKVPVFDEVCDTTGVTLTRFMNEVAMLNPELRELTTLFGAIDTACKAMTNLVKRSQLPSSETLGYQGEVNVQGEDQKKLDVITNDLLKRALRFTGRLGVLASEEEDVPVSNLLIFNRESPCRNYRAKDSHEDNRRGQIVFREKLNSWFLMQCFFSCSYHFTGRLGRRRHQRLPRNCHRRGREIRRRL